MASGTLEPHPKRKHCCH